MVGMVRPASCLMAAVETAETEEAVATPLVAQEAMQAKADPRAIRRRRVGTGEMVALPAWHTQATADPAEMEHRAAAQATQTSPGAVAQVVRGATPLADGPEVAVRAGVAARRALVAALAPCLNTRPPLAVVREAVGVAMVEGEARVAVPSPLPIHASRPGGDPVVETDPMCEHLFVRVEISLELA